MGEDTQRRRLPVWRTAKASFIILNRNRGLALKLFLIATVLQIAVYFMLFGLSYLNISSAETDEGLYPAPLFLPVAVFIFLSTAITVPAMTAWHRLILLGRSHPHANLVYRARRTEWSYFWRLSVLLVIVGVVAMMLYFFLLVGMMGVGAMRTTSVFSDLVPLLMIATTIIISVTLFAILQRLCLTLPAVAVGAGFDFRDSWRALRGNTWRLVAAFIAAGAPFLLAHVVFGVFMSRIFPDAEVDSIMIAALGFLLSLITLLIWFCSLLATTSVWSWAYRYLVEGEDIVLPGERSA